MRIDNHPLVGLWTDVDNKPALIELAFHESDRSTDYLLVKNSAGTMTLSSLSDAAYWDFWATKDECEAAIAVQKAEEEKEGG